MIDKPQQQFRCPLIFAVTGLLALFVLGVDGDEILTCSVIAVFFVLPYFFSFRLPESAATVWFIRLIVYVVSVIVTRQSDDSSADLSDPHGVVVVGCLMAAEMALQCWRRKPAGRPPGLSLILFAGTAFLAGCYTAESGVVPWLTPAFFALMTLSWRRLAMQSLRDPLSNWAKAVYILNIIVAIGIGAAIYGGVWGFRSNINQFVVSLVSNHNLPEDTGMSSDPQLGSTFGLQGSSERVLSISGDLSEAHLHAVAFDDYDNGAWGPSTRYRIFTATPVAIGTLPSRRDTITVTKLRYASGLIYFPLDATYIGLGQQESPTWCRQNGGPLRSSSLAPSTYTFAETGAQGDLVDGVTPASDIRLDSVVPATLDPAVVALSRRVTARCKSEQAKVQAICAKLDEDHTYSLTYNAPPGDPVSGFILSKKPAHCEYFASAAAVMLRCAGIPARYVIGYYAHEYDGNKIVVRQRDAHAWAEAYIDGAWTTVDATPASGMPDKLFGPVPLWQRMFESLQDRVSLLQDELRAIGPTKVALSATVFLVLYFILRLAVKELLARRRRKPTNFPVSRELSVYAERFERLLLRWKLTVPVNETWSEFFDRQVDLPIEKEQMLAVVEVYNQVRYGRDNASVDQLSELLTGLEKLEKVKK